MYRVIFIWVQSYQVPVFSCHSPDGETMPLSRTHPADVTMSDSLQLNHKIFADEIDFHFWYFIAKFRIMIRFRAVDLTVIPEMQPVLLYVGNVKITEKPPAHTN